MVLCEKMTDDENVFNYHSAPHLCLLQSRCCSCWHALYFKVNVLIWRRARSPRVNWPGGSREPASSSEAQLSKCRCALRSLAFTPSSAGLPGNFPLRKETRPLQAQISNCPEASGSLDVPASTSPSPCGGGAPVAATITAHRQIQLNIHAAVIGYSCWGGNRVSKATAVCSKVRGDKTCR